MKSSILNTAGYITLCVLTSLIVWLAGVIFGYIGVCNFAPAKNIDAMYGLVLLLVALVLLPLTRLNRRHGWVGLVCCLAVVGLLSLEFWGADNTRTPFLRSLHSVRPGMTQDQVLAIMRPYENRMGFDTGSGASGTQTFGFHHSDHGDYNADFGQIILKNGRVTKVEFSPD